jgi:L-serine dehydratase
MVRQRSLFDIVGPVMIGPSSSHTAGAVRLGLLARAIFGVTPRTARIGLHGSFASTGRGHGTDLALAAGLLGMRPDDPAIRDATALAAAEGLSVTFSTVDLSQAHPNTAVFELADETGRQIRVIGSSLGGGDVVVVGIDDFDVEMTGDLPVLLVEHKDRPGEIAAVSSVLAEAGVNIASMRVAREARGARAMMVIETDAVVDASVVDRIAATPGVTAARPVEAV